MNSSPFQSGPFGKYFLTEELFKGRHTRTFKAKTYGAKGFEKILALVKLSRTVSAQPKLIELLTEEFRRVVKVTHPNVLPFYDFGNVKDEYFLTQEYLEGLSFAELLQHLRDAGDSLSPPDCLYLMSEVLKGLHAIHSKFPGTTPLLHGHIQPRTLFLSREGEVKITGLGFERLALLYDVSDQFDSNYFDEKIRKTGKFTLKYDLFLAAMTLFELLTGFPLMSRLPEDSGENIIASAFLQNYLSGSILKFFEQAFQAGETPIFASALDMSVALQRILYSEYADFSAQNLFKKVQLFFGGAAGRQIKSVPQTELAPADTLDELVKSSRFQVNLVHREGTEYSSLMADTVALTPSEFSPATQSVVVDPAQWSAAKGLSEVSQSAKTQKSQKIKAAVAVTSHSVSSSSNGSKEPASQVDKTQRFVWIGVLGAAFLGLLLVLWIVEQKKPVPLPEDNPVEPRVQTYELSLNSNPDGAEIWIDNAFSQKVTPAEFLDWEIGRDYRIVIKKDGFEDYMTLFRNDSGKDQVLDVTLRPR